MWMSYYYCSDVNWVMRSRSRRRESKRREGKKTAMNYEQYTIHYLFIRTHARKRWARNGVWHWSLWWKMICRSVSIFLGLTFPSEHTIYFLFFLLFFSFFLSHSKKMICGFFLLILLPFFFFSVFIILKLLPVIFEVETYMWRKINSSMWNHFVAGLPDKQTT